MLTQRIPVAPALSFVALLALGCGAGAFLDTETPDIVESPPVAAFTASPTGGSAPLAVTFDASASTPGDAVPVTFVWDLDSTLGSGEVVERSFEEPGCKRVRLTVTNTRGEQSTAETTLVVTAEDVEAPPVVTFSARPLDGAVVPRDVSTNRALVALSGVLTSAGYESLVLEAYRDGELHETVNEPACATAEGVPFSFAVEIEAELVTWAFDLWAVAGGERLSILHVEDVVAGDVLLVQGQSNAVARAYSGDANVNQGPFLRSFGARNESAEETWFEQSWGLAEGNATEDVGAVGQWALSLGRRLVDDNQIPIAIINGARGGRPIGYFARNEGDPLDLNTNYGRLLARAQWAGVADAARALLFYQGESDGADAQGHTSGFTELLADWREDFAGVERFYTTQVRVGCGGPSLALRDGQRRLADVHPDLSVMSTTGLDGHDGCHFAYENGYEKLAARYFSVLSRDLYGAPDDPDVDPPNPGRVVSTVDTLVLETRGANDTLVVVGDPSGDFSIEGSDVTVTSVTAAGSTLTLGLSGDVREATGLAYNGHAGAGAWVVNGAGLGMLTFQNVPIEAP